MKRSLFIFILIVFFTMSFDGCDSQKDDYILQEKCGKQSQEWFKEKYISRDTPWSYEYTNHYNKKLNKCFSLVTELHSDGRRYFGLWDINENKEYGGCIGTIGEEDRFRGHFIIIDKDVKGKKEWDKLVNQFMTE